MKLIHVIVTNRDTDLASYEESDEDDFNIIFNSYNGDRIGALERCEELWEENN